LSTLKKEVIFVDAHVHIYDCFDENALFDSAYNNFSNEASKQGLDEEFTGLLLLTETINDEWFNQTYQSAQNNEAKTHSEQLWQIHGTPDKKVLKAIKPSVEGGKDKVLYILAGRQVNTSEGLELLALATEKSITNGLTISAALEKAHENDAIPVIPWAVGKWLGKRGAILSAVLEKEETSALCLGDNSGRPVFWKNPSHFKQAKTLNKPILPGSDPLPLPGESKKVGSFGFMLEGKLTESSLSSDLKKLLRDKTTQITAYGELEKPVRFFTNQIKLRLL